MILDLNKEVFVVYIVTFTLEMIMYLVYKVQITLIKIKEAFVTVLIEYSDFANVFYKESIIVLPKYIKIIKYAINIKKKK